jgi:DNA modification methylase
MGTGTAAVAAVKQKWDYIGYDIDEDYVTYSKDRIDKIPLTVV